MRTRVAVCAAVLLAWAVQAKAQVRTDSWPVSDIEVGYSYLHDDNVAIGGVSGSFPLGWQASASYNFTPAFGIVGDLSGHYKTDDVVPGSGLGDLSLKIHALHGGVRFTGRGSLRPYAQLLAGVTRSSLGVAGAGTSATDFSVQPGVGVMLPLSDGIGLGLGADYRVVFTEVEKTNEIRAHVGIVFHVSE